MKKGLLFINLILLFTHLYSQNQVISKQFDIRELINQNTDIKYDNLNSQEILTKTNYFSKVLGIGIDEVSGNNWAAAWVDYDNDGFDDIFICDYDSDKPNLMYRNNTDGTFTSVQVGDLTNDISNSVSSAWADFDNDGDMDVFVSNNAGALDYMYENNGDGTFSRVESTVLSSQGVYSHSAAWGDFNNDGFVDLFIGDWGIDSPNRLYMNNGDKTFTLITKSVINDETANTIGGSWVDYDNDGDVDLYVVNARDSENWLYRNDLGEFTKVNLNNIGGAHNSIGSSWGDYDNDGDLDLFIANASNQANIFVETISNTNTENGSCVTQDENGNPIGVITQTLGENKKCASIVHVTFNGCSSCINVKSESKNISKVIMQLCDGTFETHSPVQGKYDVDLCSYNGQDIIAAWVSAGCYQGAQVGGNDGYYFQSNCTQAVCFNGVGTVKCFEEINISPGSINLGHTHGGSWIDFDNDGDLDMYMVNSSAGNNYLFLNNGDGTFDKVDDPITSEYDNSFGVAWSDYDNDGDYDAYVVNHSGGQNFLWENLIGQNNNSISITLEGSEMNKTAVGAKITVYATIFGKQIAQTREISTLTSGIGSQNSMKQIFGIGDADSVDSVQVIWTVDQRGVLVQSTYKGFIAGDDATIIQDDYEFSDNIVNVGIEELMNSESESNIKAYPNPVSDRLTLEISSEENGWANVVIKDIKTNTLIIRKHNLIKGKNLFNYDLHEFSSGIHIIEIHNQKEIKTMQIMKLH